MADYGLVPQDFLRAQMALELMKANELSARFGLALGPAQIARIVDRRFQALKETGRVEFGRSVVRDLIEAFCDSPYIGREDYEETVGELIDSFYYFRGECDGLIPDDELIDCMRRHFDEVCQGSLEMLSGTTLPELVRGARCAELKDTGRPRA